MVAEPRPLWVLSGLEVLVWKLVLGALELVESEFLELVEVRLLVLPTLWVLMVPQV